MSQSVHRFVVMVAADVTDQQIADCVQTSRASLRLSVDGLSAILKYNQPCPGSMDGESDIDWATAFTLMKTAPWEEA